MSPDQGVPRQVHTLLLATLRRAYVLARLSLNNHSDVEEPLKLPKLSHLVAGQQSSTKGLELGLSCTTVQHDNVINIKEEDKVVTQ
jgi:hypothetical protein